MARPYVKMVERCAAVQTVSAISSAAFGIMSVLVIVTAVQHARIVHGHRVIHWPLSLAWLLGLLAVSTVTCRAATSLGKYAARRSYAVYNTQATGNWDNRRSVSYARRFFP